MTTQQQMFASMIDELEKIGYLDKEALFGLGAAGKMTRALASGGIKVNPAESAAGIAALKKGLAGGAQYGKRPIQGMMARPNLMQPAGAGTIGA